MKAEYEIFKNHNNPDKTQNKGVTFSQFFNTFLEQELHKFQVKKNEIECDHECQDLDEKELINCIAKFEKIYNKFTRKEGHLW